MRLTIELIEKSVSFINAVKERELDLRGNKIQAIENLGTAKDLHDTIDLTDNEIRKLENFPLMNRLKTLLMTNNRVMAIDTHLEKKLPFLENLILTNNLLQDLKDIDVLCSVATLRSLSLLDNPVSKHIRYRLYVIHKLPFLTVLDFRKITQKERSEAEALFRDS